MQGIYYVIINTLKSNKVEEKRVEAQNYFDLQNEKRFFDQMKKNLSVHLPDYKNHIEV